MKKRKPKKEEKKYLKFFKIREELNKYSKNFKNVFCVDFLPQKIFFKLHFQQVSILNELNKISNLYKNLRAKSNKFFLDRTREARRKSQLNFVLKNIKNYFFRLTIKVFFLSLYTIAEYKK